MGYAASFVLWLGSLVGRVKDYLRQWAEIASLPRWRENHLYGHKASNMFKIFTQAN